MIFNEDLIIACPELAGGDALINYLGPLTRTNNIHTWYTTVWAMPTEKKSEFESIVNNTLEVEKAQEQELIAKKQELEDEIKELEDKLKELKNEHQKVSAKAQQQSVSIEKLENFAQMFGKTGLERETPEHLIQETLGQIGRSYDNGYTIAKKLSDDKSNRFLYFCGVDPSTIPPLK